MDISDECGRVCSVTGDMKGGCIMNFQARQGDIFFRSCGVPPVGAVAKKDLILAYGEVTGHSHQIISPSLSELEMVTDKNGDIFVRGDVEILVGHDEHSVVTLPAGEWICISRQREYDVLSAEKERVVAD